jgi:hypothetical protein
VEEGKIRPQKEFFLSHAAWSRTSSDVLPPCLSLSQARHTSKMDCCSEDTDFGQQITYGYLECQRLSGRIKR